MDEGVRVRDVRYQAAPASDAHRGLLGFVSFRIGVGLRVDGVTLRRSREGRLVLSFPARRDRRGAEHPYLRPINDSTREAIEGQVFAALGLTPEGER